jgi:hypothetical protein
VTRVRWPEWWEWELELSPHLLKRMIDRRFTEVDLRTMLKGASACRRSPGGGRWAIESRLRGRSWEVVVEPDEEAELVVVIAAYPVA